MEDEDSENGLVDTWSLWEETYYKDVAMESLTQMNNSNICLDEIEENRVDCFYSSYSCESDGNGNSEASLKKKLEHIDNIKKRDDKTELKTEKMAEYTQYLGLQPTLTKPECSKCNLIENTGITESNLNQCDCSSLMTSLQDHISNFDIPRTSNSKLPLNNSDSSLTNISKMSPINTCKFQSDSGTELLSNSNCELSSVDSYQLTSSSLELPYSNSYKVSCSNNSKSLVTCSSDSSSNINSKVLTTSQASNFKITRKVYLCAACETYFENWNLFLHMREVHKRYICLFCLGMFGQAERLSRHLTKKHSIAEVLFHSVEEFYKTFKSSCYVVCCSCEKIFSETDNFYNHFCPPQINEQSNPELCSLCSQIGTHKKTCSLALKKNKKNTKNQSLSMLKIDNINSFASNSNVTGFRRYSKRIIKPNRSNEDVYLYTKLTNLRAKRSKLQNTFEMNDSNNCIASEFKVDKCTKSIVETRKHLQDSIRDTVAETIMEVSTCTEDSINNQNNKFISNESCKNNKKVTETKSSNSGNTKNIYDSVTETIMEVSCYINKSNEVSYKDKEILNKNNALNIIDCNTNKSTIKSSDLKNEDDVRLNDVINKSTEIKDIGIENNLCNDPYIDSNLDFISETSNSLNHTNRSVFSPTCETQKIITKNEKHSTKAEFKSNSISNVTPLTDRSLVIKICTRNNSVFSISTTPAALKKNSIESHGRESEENNNGEMSNNKVLLVEAHDNVKNKKDDNLKNNKPIVAYSSEDEKMIHNIKILSDNKENEEKLDISENNMDIQQEKIIEEPIIKKDKNIIDTLTNNIDNPDGILIAGEEIPIIDLNVEDLLESMKIEDLLKRCIKAVCSICVYCNHARQIAVNGKQLSLHMLAEHRFQPQHPAIIIHQEQFTAKVKNCLDNLESYYFNLDSYNSEQGTYNVSTVKVYECFLCRFYTSAHKELYLHNRKMHQKPILICIMCKSTFCSYSELLCHLCPGVYAANVNIQYRCCLCSLTNLPSAFRLMVHLRKQHHACDVCLECTGNQQRLSNHVWKHKLHHLCYRCGIAYRNKPDITKHLFWKHGTESVLCKKCLQKKWPHIYHFCIPPTAFACEECGFSFSKAVALKVHKRIHTSDFLYSCSECLDKFISKKLLTKHEKNHKEPIPSTQLTSSIVSDNKIETPQVEIDIWNTKNNEENLKQINTENISKEIIKKVIDVYDLPPLNLSSDSDSESENDKINENKLDKKSDKIMEDSNNKIEVTFDSKLSSDLNNDIIVEVERNEEEKNQEKQIMDGIWDNFKSYTASLEKQDSSTIIAIESDSIETCKHISIETKDNQNTNNLRNIILADHDYCVIYSDKIEESFNKSLLTIDNDTKINKNESDPKVTFLTSDTNRQSMENDSPKKKIKSPKKKKQNVSTSSSESSSDSDSSSCSCGTNCSCSSSSTSSSSSSSSSSDSESSVSINLSQKTNSIREKHKKEKELIKKEQKVESIKEALIKKANDAMSDTKSLESVNKQLIIMESDLDTTETETDEDFYDEQPQQLANKLIAEKRNKLMILTDIPSISIDANTSTPVNNGIFDTDTTIHSSPPSTPADVSEKIPVKRKIKTRKRKRDIREKSHNATKTVESIKLNIPKLIYQTQRFISKSSTVKKHPIVNFNANQSMFEVNQMVGSESLSSVGVSHNVGGSSSETDAKRLSKRKRVPKRFYGDSSDEENRKQILKWRRIEIQSTEKAQLPSTSKNTHHKQRHRNQQREEINEYEENENERTLVITGSGSDSNELVDSNSESSDSDNRIENKNKELSIVSHTQIHYPQFHPPNPERVNNLYCYCQCPYDEVSEMIACDGDDCQIEWFHFECVGIMVPPKGKWYCPDCRRKLGIPDDMED